MVLGAGTIYTGSLYDWSNRPAASEPRESEIWVAALATRSGIESAYGPALRGSCPDEAAGLRRRRLFGAGRHGHPLSKASGNQVLRHARRPVLAGRRGRARAGSAPCRGLLFAPAWTSVPARHRPLARTGFLYRRLRPARHAERSPGSQRRR